MKIKTLSANKQMKKGSADIAAFSLDGERA